MNQMQMDAQHLSNFNGDNTPFGQMVNDGFDDDYDGFDDDDLSFDGRSRSFKDQHNGQRLLSLTLDNSANAALDVTVGLFSSFKNAFTVCGEGATVSTEGTAIIVRSNGIAKLLDVRQFSKTNPLRVVGMRLTFTKAEQAGKIISYAYQNPFESIKETILQPESYRTERNQQDKIITIAESFTLGDQTDFKVQLTGGEKLNMFIMFGGIYNISKSLSKKNNRAVGSMAPAGVIGR